MEQNSKKAQDRQEAPAIFLQRSNVAPDFAQYNQRRAQSEEARTLKENLSNENNWKVDALPSDVYEIRPRREEGFDLISDQLRDGPIPYAGPDAVRNAVAYAKYRSWWRSHRAIVRVLD